MQLEVIHNPHGSHSIAPNWMIFRKVTHEPNHNPLPIHHFPHRRLPLRCNLLHSQSDPSWCPSTCAPSWCPSTCLRPSTCLPAFSKPNRMTCSVTATATVTHEPNHNILPIHHSPLLLPRHWSLRHSRCDLSWIRSTCESISCRLLNWMIFRNVTHEPNHNPLPIHHFPHRRLPLR